MSLNQIPRQLLDAVISLRAQMLWIRLAKKHRPSFTPNTAYTCRRKRVKQQSKRNFQNSMVNLTGHILNPVSKNSPALLDRGGMEGSPIISSLRNHVSKLMLKDIAR